MLESERMSKLFVVAPKSAMSAVVEKLHKLEIVHFIEHKKDEYDICPPLLSFEKASSYLVQARSIISTLNINQKAKGTSTFAIEDLEKDLETIRSEVSIVLDEKKEAQEKINKINNQKQILSVMNTLNVSPEDFFDSEYVVSYMGTVSKPVANDLEIATTGAIIKEVQNDKKILVSVFADKKQQEEVEKVLNAAGFLETDTSITSELKGHAEVTTHSLEKEQENLQRTVDMADSKLKNLKTKHEKQIIEIESFLSKEADKGLAPTSFGSTCETFFVTCYVPKNMRDVLKINLEEATENKVHIQEQKITDEDEVPIKLKNGKYTNNFEFFTNLYALPKYKEFDPTKLMAYTFPLFFGFMLGDVVYGMITFALFYFLKKKIPDGANFFNIMLAASVSAMVFGAFYGEYFGFEPYHGPIVRTHDFNALMMIAVLAGVVQVNLGLILGFILEYKHHGLMHAVTHKLSWVLVQIGGVLFIGPLMGLITFPTQTPFYIGIGIFTLAAILLFKAEGFIGIIEIPSILSNIISYARLMAVGLASVFVAVLINDAATSMFQGAIWMWPFGLLILIVGHTFNIALGILSPTLHSVRLHYVEFFTKFYTGGGVEYEPFGAEKQKSIL